VDNARRELALVESMDVGAQDYHCVGYKSATRRGILTMDIDILRDPDASVSHISHDTQDLLHRRNRALKGLTSLNVQILKLDRLMRACRAKRQWTQLAYLERDTKTLDLQRKSMISKLAVAEYYLSRCHIAFDAQGAYRLSNGRRVRVRMKKQGGTE
jgi:hypothetical protein